MKIDYDHEERCPVIKEVFSGAFIETAEGNRIGFWMRDDSIELNVLPKWGGSRLFRIDMETLEVVPMVPTKDWSFTQPDWGAGHGGEG